MVIVQMIVGDRCPAVLLLLMVISPISTLTAMEDVRFVPQLSLTVLSPDSVAFHPRDNNLLMVLNESGRIYVLDVSALERPIKKVEIPSWALAAAYSPNGRRIVSSGPDGTLRLWDVESGEAIGATFDADEGSIGRVAFSPDGKRIASGSFDGTVRLWNARSLMEMDAKLEGHEDGVTSVAFSPDGKRIASGSVDGTVRLWDVESGDPIGAPMEDHEDGVTSVAFSPDGKRIASGSVDGAVRLWDVESRDPIGAPMEGHYGHYGVVTSVAFSPDGKRIVSGGTDAVLLLWDMESGDRTVLGEHDFLVRSVGFSGDGKRVVSAGRRTVRLWDAKSGRRMAEPLRGHEASVASLAFTPDGKRIASGSEDGTVRLWDAESREAIGARLDADQGSVRSVAFSPDGKRIASGHDSGTVTWWNTESGEAIGTRRDADQGSVRSVAFSPDGKRIASGHDSGTVTWWNTESGEDIGTRLDTNQGSVRSVAFSPDGKRIASGHDSGTALLWNTEGEDVSAALYADQGSVRSVAFSPDGKSIVSGHDAGTVTWWNTESGEDTSVVLRRPDDSVRFVAFSLGATGIVWADDSGTVSWWNSESRESTRVFMRSHDDNVRSAIFSPDGNRIVWGYEDGTVRLLYLERGDLAKLVGRQHYQEPLAFGPGGKYIASYDGGATVRIWDLESGTAKSELNWHTVFFETVYSIAFSPDGKRIVSGDTDGAVRLWETETGEAIGAPLEGHEGSVWSVAFAPDGKRIVSGDTDGTVRLWEAESGEAIGAPLEGHEGSVWSVAFAPDGKRIVSGGTDGTVRLWEAESGEAIGAPLEGHEDLVLRVAFDPDGKRIVSGGNDGTVRLWEVESGEAIGAPLEGHENSVVNVAFSPDGMRIVSSDADGTVRLWEVESSEGRGAALEGHADTALGAAFSPDGRRTASTDGEVRLWNTESWTSVSSAPTCRTTPLGVLWLPPGNLLLSCRDRLAFFDPDLDLLGDVFLVDEALVVVAPDQGFYTNSRLTERHVLAFRHEQLVSPKPLSIEQVRHILFDDSNVWSLLKLSVYQAAQWIADAHRSLGRAAYPAWFALVWVLVALSALAMWVVCPARLAWLAMPKAGGQALPAGKGRAWGHFVGVITLFVWLGKTRRPLENWLQANRPVLEKECFTGRLPVREREKYLPLGQTEVLDRFVDRIACNKRGLVWVEGAGGSGKSAFAMYLLRSALIGKSPAPVPVFVGEDWTGSLATQVARQLRNRNWSRFPTPAMTRTLGASGLLCPLVDSLSERGMDDASARVRDAISDRDFQHLVVTSREPPSSEQALQAVERVSPRPLKRGNLSSFIEVYLPEGQPAEVEVRIEPLLQGREMPSPLFLRFAIEQAAQGSLRAPHRHSLVLDYVEALRSGRADIQMGDMRRAAGIAAIESIQEHLRPQEISEQQLRMALMREANATPFYDEAGEKEVGPAQLVEMLIRSGLMGRGTRNLQFAYDPVAEILAPWWAMEAAGRQYDALLVRIACAAETEVGRAHSEISAQKDSRTD